MALPRHPVSRVNMNSTSEQPGRAALTLGFWAAVATATTYIIFELGLLLDPVMVVPWDVWIPIGASALIAPAFLLLTVSIHYSSPAEGRIWTHSAMLFATIYAALAELVYFTWLFVVEPRVVNGTQKEVELLIFQPGSLMQMVDAAAYTSMGIAAMLAAAAFRGPKSRWPRWFAIANGPAALLVLMSYITNQLVFGIPAAFFVPAYAISVARWFRRFSPSI